MTLERRIAALEGGREHTGLGTLLDALAAEDHGAVIEWAAFPISTDFAAVIARLETGEQS
jgi:hypothetical protein